MNHQKQVRSSSIFLLELILAIFFFSLASAVCLQIFVKSHVLSQNAQKLNFAVNECSGMAELLSTTDSLNQIKSRFTLLYPMCDQSAFPSVLLYYDSNFHPCSYADATYQLGLSIENILASNSPNANAFNTFEAHIVFKELTANEPIYTLDVIRHIPQEVQP